ncbi:PHP domain-containing protein [Methanonatronarchaeum sp. AMET6-2]|uniref:PHP domain-containing protein n=1 Tax=Methanonatronarchaeum sp. AMET6-2 TaxID=2933293 RepID=UPI0011FC13C3|nr:PHP domain-containing protein [Methanonatronarchaeum sp. AMET6-2]RZN63340.1 MAG: PHP domain-containing protein [Methanonatronarchaeia archaeon]UOY10601.1 PHP domain-containing protein [Methanonatronarchaeum sp. AMET6-2]
MKVDFHVHSEYSEDSTGTVSEIIHAAEKRGLDAIAITDHDRIEGSIEAQELCRDRDLIIIPGVEVTTRDGHLLVLGINKVIEPGLSVEETVKKAKEEGAFLIVPHLFHRYRHGIGNKIDKLKNQIDAVEVYNSRYITGIANARAKRYTKKHNIPVVAGSDSHIPAMVGRGVTKINSEKSVEEIFRSVETGETEIELSKTPVSLFMKQALSSFLREVARRLSR